MLAGIIFNGLGIPVVAVLLLAIIPLMLFGGLGYLAWQTVVAPTRERDHPAAPERSPRAGR